MATNAEPINATNWRSAATELATAGRIEEAEAIVRRFRNDLGFCPTMFELCRGRMNALLAAGQTDAARAARDQAANWAFAYAAGATSGGEGAALSIERDRMIAELPKL